MTENIYEVIFTCIKDGEEHLIGPIRMQEKLREVAVAKAAIEAYKNDQFKGVKLTSLKVKVRGW